MINHKIPEEFFNIDSINIGKYGKERLILLLLSGT